MSDVRCLFPIQGKWGCWFVSAGWVPIGLGTCRPRFLWVWVFVGLGSCGSGHLSTWVLVGLGSCGSGYLST